MLMNESKINLTIMKLRIKRKIPKRVCGFRKIWSLMREYRYECSCKKFAKEFGFDYYHPIVFQVRLFLAWLVNARCEHCDADGMTGYYEREACSWCDGFALQWNFKLKNIFLWIVRPNEKKMHDVFYHEMFLKEKKKIDY